MKKFSFFLIFCLIFAFIPQISAENTEILVTGKRYEFDEDSEYEISKAKEYSEIEDGYGRFLLRGEVTSAGEKDAMAAYEVAGDSLIMTYRYSDVLLNAGLDEWHLYDDSTDEFDGIDLDEDIGKGMIWLQTSMDGKNWNDVVFLTDAFHKTPNGTEPIYTAPEIEIINGCYYKLIVAYELRMRTEESSFLFFNTDDYEYKKYAEVYDFYVYSSAGDRIEPDQTYNLGTKVHADEFDGYSGATEIVKGDIHYGWDLGNFFVSGYTDKRVNEEGKVVFLKNVGDRVTLWFRLLQDIDCLNGDDDLSVTSDPEGYDHYFETPRTDFGKGTLIIRYTDHNNNRTEPQIYTNYLEANTTPGVNTKVRLFEEGDYEIALDYQVSESGLFGSDEHYRIYFEFSVRNGNCMVYPFDVKTGSELTTSSVTENGFRLDLAKSRYLNVNIKREVLTAGADGLVEDTRFNGPAKDGAEYTDEGIYTISASNAYTDQTTVKQIYVGKNPILKASVENGLSFAEINALLQEGAEIEEDGTINTSGEISFFWVLIMIMLLVGVIIAGCFVIFTNRRKEKEAEK